MLAIIDFFWNYFYFRLPYKEHRRRVIFQGAPTLQSHDKVRNLVIQWQSPQANIKKSKIWFIFWWYYLYLNLKQNRY